MQLGNLRRAVGFFEGFSVDETAEILEVSPQTVMRDWRLARAWLAREVSK
jgi:DNA-directed RNA polymerase specialized sigma24 family protein